MTKQLIAGVDEAGRGCVLGPMVLSICIIDKSKENKLLEAGVKDSKLLSFKKREELFSVIKKEAEEYKIIVIPAEELNILMDDFSLNEIEAQKASTLITQLKTKPEIIVFDSPDTNAENFTKRVKTYLKSFSKDTKFISEHKADQKYVSVSCASILAKVTRDSLLKKEMNGLEISGYSSDPKTIDYLKDYFLKNKNFPKNARLKWKTLDNIVKDLYQKKLF